MTDNIAQGKTLRCGSSFNCSPKASNSNRPLFDAFSVGLPGGIVSVVGFRRNAAHPTLYCLSPLATCSSFQTTFLQKIVLQRFSMFAFFTVFI
ncbi:MAG: hypothetical protein ACR2IA_03100, partial [Pyrinomonadaceae bacterium]